MKMAGLSKFITMAHFCIPSEPRWRFLPFGNSYKILCFEPPCAFWKVQLVERGNPLAIWFGKQKSEDLHPQQDSFCGLGEGISVNDLLSMSKNLLLDSNAESLQPRRTAGPSSPWDMYTGHSNTLIKPTVKGLSNLHEVLKGRG